MLLLSNQPIIAAAEIKEPTAQTEPGKVLMFSDAWAM